MYKKSFLMVLLIVGAVFATAFTRQMIETQHLPSSYDPGLTIDQAFKTAKTPLFVEFYTDSCGTCRRVSPMVHELMKDEWQGKMTLVMLDVENPQNQQAAQLFGVDELPAIYVFDFKNMRKHQIDDAHFESKDTLYKAVNEVLTVTIPNSKPRKLDPSRAPQMSSMRPGGPSGS